MRCALVRGRDRCLRRRRPVRRKARIRSGRGRAPAGPSGRHPQGRRLPHLRRAPGTPSRMDLWRPDRRRRAEARDQPSRSTGPGDPPATECWPAHGRLRRSSAWTRERSSSAGAARRQPTAMARHLVGAPLEADREVPTPDPPSRARGTGAPDASPAARPPRRRAASDCRSRPSTTSRITDARSASRVVNSTSPSPISTASKRGHRKIGQRGTLLLWANNTKGDVPSDGVRC